MRIITAPQNAKPTGLSRTNVLVAGCDVLAVKVTPGVPRMVTVHGKCGEISEKTTFFTLLPPFSVVFMPNNLQIPHYFSYFTGFLARGRLPATLAGDSTTPETWTSFLA